MAHIFKRPNSRFWWISWLEGGQAQRKSLKVTSKAQAEVLLSEYTIREAKTHNRSKVLRPRVFLEEVFDDYISNCIHRDRTINMVQGA